MTHEQFLASMMGKPLAERLEAWNELQKQQLNKKNEHTTGKQA